jgi:hypothetical protein
MAMSEPEDPTLWKRGASGAPDGFAELMHSDAHTGPTHAELTRVIERLAVQVSAPELAQAFRSGAGAQPAAATAHRAATQVALRSSSSARLGLFAKWIAGMCALGAVAFAIFELAATHRSEESRPTMHNAAKPPGSSQVSMLAADARSHEGAATQAATPTPAIVPQPVVAPPQQGHRSAAAPAPDAAGELRLLESAQQALRDDPARALAIAEQHRRRFAHGEFAQEREMLAIDALMALGQRERAAARARAFARRYPNSTHLPHLRDLVHATP